MFSSDLLQGFYLLFLFLKSLFNLPKFEIILVEAHSKEKDVTQMLGNLFDSFVVCSTL